MGQEIFSVFNYQYLVPTGHIIHFIFSPMFNSYGTLNFTSFDNSLVSKFHLVYV